MIPRIQGQAFAQRQLLIANKLAALKLVQLQALSKACGLCIAGTKAGLIANYLQFGKEIERESFEQVISLDLGYQNFAFAKLTRNYKLVELQRVNLNLPLTYDPISYAQLLKEFINTNFCLPEKGTTTFLLERQRHRTMGRAAVPESILKVNFIEVQLHCLLLGQAKMVQPGSVSRYFDLPTGRDKKRAATMLAKCWLEQRHDGVLETGQDAFGPRHGVLNLDFQRPPEQASPVANAVNAVNPANPANPAGAAGAATHSNNSDTSAIVPKIQFGTEKKKDDMADALLQAIAFLDWRRNYHDQVDKLLVS